MYSHKLKHGVRSYKNDSSKCKNRINKTIKRYLAIGMTFISMVNPIFPKEGSFKFVDPLVEHPRKKQEISEDEINTILEETRDWLLIADGHFNEVDEQYLSKPAQEALSIARKFDGSSLEGQYLMGKIFTTYYDQFDPLEKNYFDHLTLKIITNLHNHHMYKQVVDLGLEYLSNDSVDLIGGLYVLKMMSVDYKYLSQNEEDNFSSSIFALYYGYTRLSYDCMVLDAHWDDKEIFKTVEEKFKITVPSDVYYSQ